MDVVVNEFGNVRSAPFSNLLMNHYGDLTSIIIDVVESELQNPHSRLIFALRQALENIADEEVEKVLKSDSV